MWYWLVFLTLFLQCNMLFYRKNQVEPHLSHYKKEVFAEILLQWKERQGHPLSGTTLKKDYQTMINIVSFSVGRENQVQIKPIQSLKWDHWVLVESVYVLQLKPLKLIFLYGKGEYGKEIQFGYYFHDRFTSINIKKMRGILPSPDGQSLLVITPEQLQVFSINSQIQKQKEIHLPFVIEDERFFTWDPKGLNKIFFQQGQDIYEYNIEKNRIDKAKQFPECFIPSTLWGGNYDEEGNQFFWENKRYYVRKMKRFIPFKKKKYISDASRVLYRCF